MKEVKNNKLIRRYFEELEKWDGVSRIGKLATYFSLGSFEEDMRLSNHLTKMLVRVIAGALNEDSVNRYVFILVSEKQRIGKSEFFRWLCPSVLQKYYTEDIDLENEDGLTFLSNNLIINLDELSVLYKTEKYKVESMISQVSVNVRSRNEKKCFTMPRISSFVGTTNEVRFLDDPGAERWLCFDVNHIDRDYRNDINIDDLWAEAFHLFINGFESHLTADELEENERANERFAKQR